MTRPQEPRRRKQNKAVNNASVGGSVDWAGCSDEGCRCCCLVAGVVEVVSWLKKQKRFGVEVSTYVSRTGTTTAGRR